MQKEGYLNLKPQLRPLKEQRWHGGSTDDCREAAWGEGYVWDAAELSTKTWNHIKKRDWTDYQEEEVSSRIHFIWLEEQFEIDGANFKR